MYERGAPTDLAFVALQDGETPLMLAVAAGHADAVQVLLDMGANRNAEVMVLSLNGDRFRCMALTACGDCGFNRNCKHPMAGLPY